MEIIWTKEGRRQIGVIHEENEVELKWLMEYKMIMVISADDINGLIFPHQCATYKVHKVYDIIIDQ